MRLFFILCIIVTAFLYTKRVNAQFNRSALTPETLNIEPRTQNSLKGTSAALSTSSGMCFTPNKGQLADKDGKPCPDVLYKGEGGGTDVYIRKTGISYVLSDIGKVMHEIEEEVEEREKNGNTNHEELEKLKQELQQKATIHLQRIDMDFVGSSRRTTIEAADRVDGYTNYYYAHCPNGILNVNSFNIITQKNIYRGIDVKYYASTGLSTSGGKQNGLKYDIVVNPGANPNDIKLKYRGAEVKLENGKLKVESPLGTIIETLPKVYQNMNGKIVDVKAEYKLASLSFGDLPAGQAGRRESEDFVTFELGTWNPELPLIIDPWATYYGGTGNDYGYSVACDNTSNVYLAGYTNSPNTGNVMAVAPGFQTVLGGIQDAFLVKFNSLTGARAWATYYGGTSSDLGYSVACDNTGNVYLAGNTQSNNAIASPGSFQIVFGGSYDAFLVKFNSLTGARNWATYYGGTGSEYGYSVACDNTGNVYLAGYTNSPNTGNVMAVAPGFQTVLGGIQDAFLVKFNSLTGARAWATYYGGTGSEYGYSVACDNTGNVYLAGRTNSPNTGNVMAVAPGFQTVLGGGTSDAFLVKFNSLTGARAWATYYGGTGWEFCHSVACDNTGNVYLTGYTNGPNTGNVIATPGAFQTAFGGSWDAYLVQFNSLTGARNWATYYGSVLYECVALGGCLAIDGNNNVYLYMEVEDAPGPNLIDPCAYQPDFAGGTEDQMIVKFNSEGKKLCATYFGGTGYEDLDYGGAIAISGNQLFICVSNGQGIYGAASPAGGYPVTPGAWQTVHGGGSWDAVLASLCINICEGKTLSVNFTTQGTCPLTFTPVVDNSCDTTGYTYQWTFAGGSPAASTDVNPQVSFANAGSHAVNLTVTTPCKQATFSNTISTTTCINTCTLSAQYIKGTASCTGCGCKEWVLVNATGGTNPYTYSWPDGYTYRYKNQLCPGTYTINIKDKNGCNINVNLSAP